MGSDYLYFHKYNKKSIDLIADLKIPLTIFETAYSYIYFKCSQQDNDYNLIEAGALFAKIFNKCF